MSKTLFLLLVLFFTFGNTPAQCMASDDPYYVKVPGVGIVYIQPSLDTNSLGHYIHVTASLNGEEIGYVHARETKGTFHVLETEVYKFKQNGIARIMFTDIFSRTKAPIGDTRLDGTNYGGFRDAVLHLTSQIEGELKNKSFLELAAFRDKPNTPLETREKIDALFIQASTLRQKDGLPFVPSTSIWRVGGFAIEKAWVKGGEITLGYTRVNPPPLPPEPAVLTPEETRELENIASARSAKLVQKGYQISSPPPPRSLLKRLCNALGLFSR